MDFIAKLGVVIARVNYKVQAPTVDFIAKLGVVIASEDVEIKFSDPFLLRYRLSNYFLVGYRFDLEDWIYFFWDRTIPVLSSMYVALVPLSGDFLGGWIGREEMLYTEDYQLITNGGPFQRIELGWRINASWDVFFYDYRTSVGPFPVRTEQNTIVYDTLKIHILHLGVHYTY